MKGAREGEKEGDKAAYEGITGSLPKLIGTPKFAFEFAVRKILEENASRKESPCKFFRYENKLVLFMHRHLNDSNTWII